MNKTVLAVACAIAAVLALVAFVVRRGEGVSVPVPRATRTVVGAVESPPTAHAVGVMVNAPLRSSTSETEELAFYGTFSRTRLAIELVAPAGGMFELDREASVVTAFTDDLGADLLDPEDHFGPLEMMPRIAEDGRSMLFVVGSKVLPGRAAGALRAEGTLAVRVSEERVLYASEEVRLEKGSAFEVGPFSFEVSEHQASEWGEGWATTLVTRADPSAVVSWTLVDAEGEEHAWSSRMSMSGGGTWHKTLASEERHDQVVVRIEAWKDPRLEKIPFAVEAGLGLH